MRSLLVTNIGELVTGDPNWGEGPLGIRRNAALVVDGRRVEWIGRATDTPVADARLDVDGAAVLPGFVDSHSHLVFGGDRAAEFAARMAGQRYTGGGIRTTVGATRAADDDQLRANVARLRNEALRQGTTTMEIKSGYGLSVADEARSLRIAREFTSETTFLGAHVVPAEYADRTDDYVSLVCGPMLTAARAAGARWIDVFCERGAFDADHSRAILTVGADAGLGVRVHANQLSEGPGVQLAVELQAASADHCTHLSAADIAALAGGSTVATLLPGAEFSTRSPYPPARALLDAGATVALATDCNPGSSYTTSIPFCIALAVREMAMTPAEAVLAATRGGAAALRRDDIGRLTHGARGDLVVLDAPSHVHLAYRPGVPLISNVVLNGELV
ncbi:imidazolonepropionase [Dactylosporangium matsuzakiense]|uniref:Imidazolonepropionase n=1 Tax=Dactylosporangium matsuzakiense TaxID=53360 RepID=A0A9W6NKW6_9ACTN|nr:imidazolonepropionase [Dactylosporangium matsuzakiense]UWZ44030.1 imidazolonepropionase [Dactylosporangium matsuzakiense]GLL00719.1 imidazolonepropionase [Dactylosporangium matsuzakiense]